MGTHKRVQRGHAVCHLVRIPITLGQVRRHTLHRVKAAQIRALRLCADGHVRRLGFFADFHGQGIDRSGAIELDDRPVLHRDGLGTPVFRLANGDFYEIVLVRGGGGQANIGRAYGQHQRVLRRATGKRRGQRSHVHGQRRQRLIGAAPIAANVHAPIQRVHQPYLIIRRQLIRLLRVHRNAAKAHVGKPAVEGAHPAGHTATVIGRQPVHFRDVVELCALLRVPHLCQRRDNAVRCGRGR